MEELKMSNVHLIKGDCLEKMKNISDKSVHMILCDLPYGTTACKWDTRIPFEPLWEQYNRIIKDNGAIVLFGSEPFSSALRMSNIKNYKYDWKWDKITGAGHLNAKHRPMQRVEDIMVFSKNKHFYYPQMEALNEEDYKKKIAKIPKERHHISNSELTGKRYELPLLEHNLEDYKKKYPSNILIYSKYMKECNNTKRVHPTQKPVDLLEYLIKTYTNEGETVLDNTMGSGSTGIACLKTNRNFIGIEQDDKYFDIAKNRINTYIGDNNIDDIQLNISE